MQTKPVCDLHSFSMLLNALYSKSLPPGARVPKSSSPRQGPFPQGNILPSQKLCEQLQLKVLGALQKAALFPSNPKGCSSFSKTTSEQGASMASFRIVPSFMGCPRQRGRCSWPQVSQTVRSRGLLSLRVQHSFQGNVLNYICLVFLHV